MSFGEHLDELRTRLWRALVVPLPLGIVFFFLAPYFREVLIAPLFAALRANGQTSQIQALSPAETITTDMKLAVIAAVCVSAPWLIYQLWLFVSPGLYVHERRYARFLTPLSAVMTFLGIAVFYWVLLPFSLLFLVGFGAAQPRSVPVPAAQVAPDGTPIAEQDPQGPKPFAFELREQDPEAPAPGQAWVSTTDQVLRIAVHDREGLPVAGRLDGVLRRPLEREEIALAPAAAAPGLWLAEAPARPGQWEARLRLTAADGRHFDLRQRVVVP
jgi:hypothetical protein